MTHAETPPQIEQIIKAHYNRDGGALKVKESIMYRPYVRRGAIAIFFWLILAATFSAWVVDSNARKSYFEVKSTVDAALDEGHQSIERSIDILYSIPSTIGKIESVQAAIHESNLNPISKALNAGQAMTVIDKKGLDAVNQKLADVIAETKAMSVLWVIDKSGRTIAASNSKTDESFVGTDYSDREYFQEAMNGKLGQQYALGRVTNVPGLFFSAPVKLNGKVIGVVAGKVNMSILSHWVAQSSGFITDQNGVIIAAHDQSLEMKTLESVDIRSQPQCQMGFWRK
jgi:C4-dicarboxylate-specific signal transduction histidine kinase